MSLSSPQGVYRWGVGWMMRRRTCHGPSRSTGERPSGTSNTKTDPHRSQLDRPLPASLLPCPRRRTTTTTASASTRSPAVCNVSLIYLFTVRMGDILWASCSNLMVLECATLNESHVVEPHTISHSFCLVGSWLGTVLKHQNDWNSLCGLIIFRCGKSWRCFFHTQFQFTAKRISLEIYFPPKFD